MDHQKTLAKTVRIEGIGLHTGAEVSLAVHPAPEDTGILFKRIDLPGKPAIKATYKNVINCMYATTIGKESFTISTIEHLMAAFCGLGIDNAVVELTGPEVPALDGSSFIFTLLFEEAGIKLQDTPKRYIAIKRKIEVTDGDKKVTFLPSKDLLIEFAIDFAHPVIKSQWFNSQITPSVFKKKVCKARTFGFLKEVEFLYKNGLAKGASLDNAIVIGENSILNKEGLRFDDEFVRHKVLDLIGDLYLLGLPIKAKIRAEKSGHALHLKAINTLMENNKAWEIVTPTPSRSYTDETTLNTFEPWPARQHQGLGLRAASATAA